MKIETSDGGEDIATIRIQNTVANVLDIDAIAQLKRAIEEASNNSRAVVLCGGDKFFCNGLDLHWAIGLDRSQLQKLFHLLWGLICQILEAPIPIVGAMKGHAIGAGKTLLVATDYRCAASGRALVGMPEIKLGVPNPYFAEQLLRFLVADSAASALIYSGELITAEQAMAIGLVDSTHEKSEVEAAAIARARTMASLPRLAFQH